MNQQGLRAFLILFSSILLLASSIIGCGSTASAPAATCSAINPAGFYAASSITAATDSNPSEIYNLIKSVGWMAYFNLASDNTGTFIATHPNAQADPADQSTGAIVETSNGTWSVAGNNITINAGDYTLTGTLSQAAYPDCFVSMNISSPTDIPNGNATTPGSISFVAQQYRSDFALPDMAATYTLSDSNGILNHNRNSTDNPLSANPYTISASSNTGTYTAITDKGEMTGALEMTSNYTLVAQVEVGSYTQYFAYNPSDSTLILMTYGLEGSDESGSTLAVTSYNFFTAQ